MLSIIHIDERTIILINSYTSFISCIMEIDTDRFILFIFGKERYQFNKRVLLDNQNYKNQLYNCMFMLSYFYGITFSLYIIW